MANLRGVAWICGLSVVWMDEWKMIDAWMLDGWMDGWISEWVNLLVRGWMLVT